MLLLNGKRQWKKIITKYERNLIFFKVFKAIEVKEELDKTVVVAKFETNS